MVDGSVVHLRRLLPSIPRHHLDYFRNSCSVSHERILHDRSPIDYCGFLSKSSRVFLSKLLGSGYQSRLVSIIFSPSTATLSSRNPPFNTSTSTSFACFNCSATRAAIYFLVGHTGQYRICTFRFILLLSLITKIDQDHLAANNQHVAVRIDAYQPLKLTVIPIGISRQLKEVMRSWSLNCIIHAKISREFAL